MATIKYYLRSKSTTAKIYIQFTDGRAIKYRKATPLIIDSKYFNEKTGKARQIASFKGKDAINQELQNLSTFILDKHLTTIKENNSLNSGWLENCINDYFNIVEVTDLNLLGNYADYYLTQLRLKTNPKTGAVGLSENSIKKYRTIVRKIHAFEKFKKRRYKLIDVDVKLSKQFLQYLLDIENIGRNSAGRYIKAFKTIGLDAKRNGHATNTELELIKGFSIEAKKTYLSWDELKQIEDTVFTDTTLEVAKDWLLIGCHIGQRAGDLLRLTNKNITVNAGRKCIELVQEKTKKRVIILLHPKVKEILTKYKNNFPPIQTKNIESVKTIFNKQIKEVCKISGITEIIEGAKVDTKTNRKVNGFFSKHELITSHICRRSFATNHYGDLPTPLIMNVTGHGSEKEFLRYIGKTPLDYMQQMGQYWDLQQQKQAIKNNEIEPLRKVD